MPCSRWKLIAETEARGQIKLAGQSLCDETADETPIL
jgi:hypothetical protein